MTVPDSLLLPVLLLAGVALAAVVLLLTSGHNKRLAARVASLAVADEAVNLLPSRERGRSIRIASDRGGDRIWLLLARLLQVPRGLPGAHVVPARLVFVLGFLVAVTAALGLRLYLPLPLAIPIGLVVGAMLLRGIFGWEHAKYQRLLLQQLPDTVEMVVSATRAGLPVSEAFRSVAREMPSPTKEEFAGVINEMSLGIAPEDALLAVHRRTGVSEYAIFAVTIGVQTRSGGRLAETIQNLAETVRQRQALAQRAQALAGEAKVSAIVLGSLPFLAGAGLSAMRPGYLDPLFFDPRGQHLLVIAVVGLVLGIWTMRRMIRKATSD